MFIVC